MVADLTVAIRRFGRGALDLVFPPRCLACSAGGAFLCAPCVELLEPAKPPRCVRCWRPWQAGGVCASCRAASPPFDGLRASYVFGPLARTLVHALKYQGMTAAAGPMASLMARTARARVQPADLIVPVPLSGLRKRSRGFNQAEALSRTLGRLLGLPVDAQTLRRVRHTPAQARSASRERRANVAGAFAARPDVDGRRVLLVDDVTTTGATFWQCALALREAGARSVWALAFAHED